MKKLVLALTTLTFLASCNTIEGIGKDMQSTGKAVSSTARNVKDNIKSDKVDGK